MLFAKIGKLVIQTESMLHLSVFPRDYKVSAVVSRHKMYFDQSVKELNSSSAIKGFGD